MLECLFNLKCCEIFKSSYFEEHSEKAGSKNVFMKPYDETEKKLNLFTRNFNFILKKQVKMFIFIS